MQVAQAATDTSEAQARRAGVRCQRLLVCATGARANGFQWGLRVVREARRESQVAKKAAGAGMSRRGALSCRGVIRGGGSFRAGYATNAATLSVRSDGGVRRGCGMRCRAVVVMVWVEEEEEEQEEAGSWPQGCEVRERCTNSNSNSRAASS